MAKRGRPSLFQRDGAVRIAMELFWAKGYEGVTLDDLVAAIGINPPSFYNAFGSKEVLFKEAVDLYVETVVARGARILEEAPTARDGLAAAIRYSVEASTQPGKPRGCMLLSAAVHCAPANKESEEYVTALRRQSHRHLRRRLRRGQEAGEIPAGIDLDAVAGYYAMVLQGIAVRAEDGATRRELLAAGEAAMTAWPNLVAARPGEKPQPRAAR